MEATPAAAVCIAAPEWFWFGLLLLLSFTLFAVPSSHSRTCPLHIWSPLAEPDTTHARREQERRQQRHVKKEGRKRRALDELKNGARTKLSRLATWCSRMLSAKAKDVTRDGNDLNWVNEEKFDMSDDEAREKERGRPRSRTRRRRGLAFSGRPPFASPRSLSKLSNTCARSSSRRFGPPPSYATSCLLEILREGIALEKEKLLLLKSMSQAASHQRSDSDTTTSTGSTPNSSEQQSSLQLTLVNMAPSVVHPLPLLGTPGAPTAFEGRNVTSFLKKFEAMCDNFGIEEAIKVKRVPEYCEDDIAREVESFGTWKAKDWEGLKKEMLKEWRQGDVEQLMYTRPLLEEFVGKCRGKEGLKQYFRQFHRISTVLVGKNELDDYSRGRLFVLGLPEDVRKQVLSKEDIGSEAATGTVNYDKALKVVKDIVVANERMESFFMRPERQSEISNLAVSMNEPKPALTGDLARVTGTAEKDKSQKDQQEDVMDKLTKSLSTLTLPLTAAISKLEAAATKPPEKTAEGFRGARLDPALDRRYGQRQPWSTLTCYMCGHQGHTLNRCDHTKRLMDGGQIHLNAENRPCLGPPREGAMPVMRQQDLTLLETIEKLLKLREPSAPTKVTLIRAVVEDDSDVEVGDSQPVETSVEAFGARADIQRGKRAVARPDPTDPVRDPRMRAAKQIAQKQDKYPVMKNLRTGTWEPQDRESSGTLSESDAAETIIVNEEPMEDAPREQTAAATKATKEKVPKTSLKKLLAGHADPMAVIERMLQQTVTISWAEALSLSGDLRKVMFGTFADPKAIANQPIETQVSKVTAKIEAEAVRAYGNIERITEALYIAASPTATVHIDGHKVKALIDSGAEVSVMTMGLAEELRLPISHIFKINMSGATGKMKAFHGLCEDVPIEIGKIVHKVPVWVIDRLEHALVLGRPYQKTAQLKLEETPDGGTEATIYTPDGTGMVSWTAVRPREDKDQTREDLLRLHAVN
jgi:hypothetical protein